MQTGFLYISADDSYLVDARRSAQSVKNAMPQFPIAIITNADEPGDVFDISIDMHSPDYSVVDKSNNIHRTPFDRTIYLDNDTYITEDISEIFDILEMFDLAVTHTPRPRSININIDVPNAFPQYQAGVIAYQSNERVNELFKIWRSEFEKHRKRDFSGDQPSFRKAIFDSNADICTLRQEYNCLIYFGQYLNGSVKIVHGHDDLHKKAEQLNQTNGPRTYTSLFQNKILFVDEQLSDFVQLAFFSLQTDGLSGTVRRIYKKFLR